MHRIIEKMPDTQTLTRLFRICFPKIIRKPSTVEEIVSRLDNRALVCEKDGTDVGVILWNGNVVIMLCVLPQYRDCGIGSALLAALEERLKRTGFEEIRFCDGFDYLTPGIPIWEEIPSYRQNRVFFEKRGYSHAWGDCECVDMAMDMSDYMDDGHQIGETVNGVTYRFASEEDMQRVLECTLDGYSAFTEYYRNPALYAVLPDNGIGERVLIAETDGLIAGTLMVCFETEQSGVGSVGCTVTRTAYRNRGIATTMVRLGTGTFLKRGIFRAYLGYTYTDVVPMYARSGYAISMRYFMGVKTLG